MNKNKKVHVQGSLRFHTQSCLNKSNEKYVAMIMNYGFPQELNYFDEAITHHCSMLLLINCYRLILSAKLCQIIIKLLV